MGKTKYEDLPYLPNLVAEQLCLASNEKGRKKMTLDEIREFADICDARCKQAYEAKAAWFMKIVRSKDGRPALRAFMDHWLRAYIGNPKILDLWRKQLARPAFAMVVTNSKTGRRYMYSEQGQTRLFDSDKEIKQFARDLFGNAPSLNIDSIKLA